MSKEVEKLKSVWDSNSLEALNSVPDKAFVSNSDDPIYFWLREIKNKDKKLKFLDEGCGIGQYVTGARLLGFKTEGIDISPISVKIGKERGEKIVLGDMRNLPFKDSEFDVVIAGGSMEHFPETLRGLMEANRVLKNNGYFLLNVPYKFTIYVVLKKIQQVLGLWKSGYEKSFSKREFENLLRKAGFRVLDVKKSRISGGRRFPLLVKLIGILDEPFYRLGFGGHHIWFKCKKYESC